MNGIAEVSVTEGMLFLVMTGPGHDPRSEWLRKGGGQECKTQKAEYWQDLPCGYLTTRNFDKTTVGERGSEPEQKSWGTEGNETGRGVSRHLPQEGQWVGAVQRLEIHPRGCRVWGEERSGVAVRSRGWLPHLQPSGLRV